MHCLAHMYVYGGCTSDMNIYIIWWYIYAHMYTYRLVIYAYILGVCTYIYIFKYMVLRWL